MVYFHDWPDVTIHTNKDQPENEPVRPAEISEYLDLLAKARVVSFR
jgi:hypothetical protein